MSRIYFAYGSNMNVEQMGVRCPTARRIGTGVIHGYRLLFKGCNGRAVATIEPFEKAFVPIVIWSIEPADERSLDRYEGFPTLYNKEHFEADLGGDNRLPGMAYVMVKNYSTALPSEGYFNTILDGYDDNGIDVKSLFEALSISSSK